MKNRVLMSDGSYREFKKPVEVKAVKPVEVKAVKPVEVKAVKPVEVKAVKPVEVKAVKPVDLLEETEVPAVIVDADYTIMSFKQLKGYAIKKGLVFKGNVSQKKLLELLVKEDKKVNGTTEKVPEETDIL